MTDEDPNEVTRRAMDELLAEADRQGRSNEVRGAGLGAGGGAALGALVGGPVGAAVGGAVGAWLGAVVGRDADR